MHLKDKLRHLLRDNLKLHPNASPKEKISHPRDLVQSYKLKKYDPSEPHSGCFLRILATKKSESEEIETILHQQRDTVGIVSLRTDQTGYNNSYPYCVIVESSLGDTFKDIWQSYKNEDSLCKHIRKIILRDIEHESDIQRKLVIDFSSPNIAKPFHFGHLKSTILGNYLANINTFLSTNVTRLNYLGDWGTQYGLVSLGFDRFGDEKCLEQSSLKHLLDVYVKASNLASEDETFYKLAREKFLLMDKEGDENELKQWARFRELSLLELRSSYSRLGINFDFYDFESDYRYEARELVQLLGETGLLRTEDNGAKLIECLRHKKKYPAPVLKSDGASLYLTRDIAAAIDRYNRFRFDEMLYVVGEEQEHHFCCLFDTLRQLDMNWYEKLNHVVTGKVLGMSTRSGQFVLLDDIIEEVTKRYIESTKNTPTSKLEDEEDVKETSFQLALSALFVYDMRNPRRKGYAFDWDTIMVPSQKSGLAIQAAYARLSSLISAFSDIEARIVDVNYIQCFESAALLTCLNRFDDVIFHSYKIMDPSPLVQYAFELCICSNRALQSMDLIIRGEIEDKASTRLALFSSVHNVLGTIIQLIGLKPLKRI